MYCKGSLTVYSQEVWTLKIENKSNKNWYNLWEVPIAEERNLFSHPKPKLRLNKFTVFNVVLQMKGGLSPSQYLFENTVEIQLLIFIVHHWILMALFNIGAF
jgi:hypothetical protein